MSETIDIGQQLLKARELKNLSPRDIEQSTRIPSATITALENNDYSALPISYARSFLAQYSEYLQVDASELISSLVPDEDITNIGYLKSNQDTVSEKRGSSPKTRSNKKRKKSLGQLQSATHQDEGKKMALPLAIVGFALMIIMGICFFIKKGEAQTDQVMQSAVEAGGQANKKTGGNSSLSSGASASNNQSTMSNADIIGVFDTIPSTKIALDPNLNPKSLIELAGFADTNNVQQATSDGVPSSTDNGDTSEMVLPERNSAPPKAMVIEEDDE